MAELCCCGYVAISFGFIPLLRFFMFCNLCDHVGHQSNQLVCDLTPKLRNRVTPKPNFSIATYCTAHYARQHGIALTQGHVVRRSPWKLHALFGLAAPTPLQNINNEVAPSSDYVHSLAISLCVLCYVKCYPMFGHLDSRLSALLRCALKTKGHVESRFDLYTMVPPF